MRERAHERESERERERWQAGQVEDKLKDYNRWGVDSIRITTCFLRIKKGRKHGESMEGTKNVERKEAPSRDKGTGIT